MQASVVMVKPCGTGRPRFADIFGVLQPQRTPHEGDLLIVEPLLDEVYFKRSVILLIEHKESEGTIGLILNKSADVILNNVLTGIDCKHEIPLYLGGPVETDKLMYIHTLSNDIISDSLPLGNGLSVGGNFNDVMLYINSKDYDERRIKFFAGYCGWHPGQLASEINEKTWVVTSLNDVSSAITACGNAYWVQLVEHLGKHYRTWLNCPSEPFYN